MHFTILLLLVGIPTALALTFPNPVFNDAAPLATITVFPTSDCDVEVGDSRVIDLELNTCYSLDGARGVQVVRAAEGISGT